MGRIGIYPGSDVEKEMVEKQYGKPVVRMKLGQICGETKDHPAFCLRYPDGVKLDSSRVISVSGRCVVETLNTIYILEEF